MHLKLKGIQISIINIIKEKHKHNVFKLVGELFRQGVKMFFLRKSVKQKEKSEIPETI